MCECLTMDPLMNLSSARCYSPSLLPACQHWAPYDEVLAAILGQIKTLGVDDPQYLLNRHGLTLYTGAHAEPALFKSFSRRREGVRGFARRCVLALPSGAAFRTFDSVADAMRHIGVLKDGPPKKRGGPVSWLTGSGERSNRRPRRV